MSSSQSNSNLSLPESQGKSPYFPSPAGSQVYKFEENKIPCIFLVAYVKATF
jgi:hypothetical protein